jgi:hypothetical protein
MKWIAAHYVWDALAQCSRWRAGYWWKFVAAKPGNPGIVRLVAEVAGSPALRPVCWAVPAALLGGAAVAPHPPYSPASPSQPAATASGFPATFAGSPPGAFLPSLASGLGDTFLALPPCCFSEVAAGYPNSPPGGWPVVLPPPWQPVPEPSTLLIVGGGIVIYLLAVAIGKYLKWRDRG